jgi:hypothetical protein
MPALNFQRQFMAAVLKGTKCQTIRATRQRPIKVGDMLYLFTGMRTKECLRLRATRCTEVAAIEIRGVAVSLDGRWLSLRESERLAAADGFEDMRGFLEFFHQTHGLLFRGQLIRWGNSQQQ